MYKIIFSDMDGTLLNSKHEISAATIQQIKSLKASFVLVSARMPAAMRHFLKETGPEPMVSYGGALVFDASGNIIFDNGMETARALDIKAYIQNHFSVMSCIYAYDYWIVDDLSDPRVRKEAAIVNLTPCEADAKSFLTEKVIQNVHKVFCIGEPAEIERIETSLKEKNWGLAVSRSKINYLEIQTAGISKLRGAKAVCDIYGISLSESISFGDSENDLEMLRGTGRGYAMKNAPADVRQNTGYVTSFDNEHDGLAVTLAGLFGEGLIQ